MPGIRGKGMAKKASKIAKRSAKKKPPARKKTGMRGGGMVKKR